MSKLILLLLHSTALQDWTGSCNLLLNRWRINWPIAPINDCGSNITPTFGSRLESTVTCTIQVSGYSTNISSFLTDLLSFWKEQKQYVLKCKVVPGYQKDGLQHAYHIKDSLGCQAFTVQENFTLFRHQEGVYILTWLHKVTNYVSGMGDVSLLFNINLSPISRNI